jgi:hypothetical protein
MVAPLNGNRDEIDQNVVLSGVVGGRPVPILGDVTATVTSSDALPIIVRPVDPAAPSADFLPFPVTGMAPVNAELAVAVRSPLDAIGDAISLRVDMASLPAFASTPDVRVVDPTSVPSLVFGTTHPEQAASACEAARAAGNASYLAQTITPPPNRYAVILEVAFVVNDDTVTSDNPAVACDALQRALSWPSGPQPFVCGGFTTAAPSVGFFPNKTEVALPSQIGSLACGAWGLCGRGSRWMRGVVAAPGESIYVGWRSFAAPASSADMVRMRIQYAIVDAAGLRLMLGGV